MASYPGAVKTFTSKSDGAGNRIFAAHINDLQDEVTAIEDGLLNGSAPINGSNATFPRVTVSSLCACSSLSVAFGGTMSSLQVGDNLNVLGPSSFTGDVTCNANVGINAGLSLNGQLQLNGVQTSTFGGGDFNNLSVASTVFHLRLYCSTASTLSGIAGAGGVRRMLLLTNVGGATMTLRNNNSSSVSSNRMFFNGAADSTLGSGGSLFLFYDATGWRGVTR